MEIVTGFNPQTGAPDISTPEEAKEYLTQLRQILLFLGVCDGKMEEGSLRCEPNISVRPAGSHALGTKTELKNLNSFRSVQLGVQYEVRRQVAVLEAGEQVRQETRGWNEQREASYVMRAKEEENDYRYFPDPDLAPMAFDAAQIERLRETIPELPIAKQRRYREVLELSAYDASVMTADTEWSAYFDEAVASGGEPKAICNWMQSDFSMFLNSEGIGPRASRVSPAHLVELTQLIATGTISGKMAKEIFREVYNTGRTPTEIVNDRGATQLTDADAIREIVLSVLSENPEIVAKYRSGTLSVKGFLVGQVMKQSGGRANPQLVQRLMAEVLEAE
jgi:aspartyl-tRNA(Asn)/glutamyl-tRNA(Gln) amidotransferase subunit B